MKKKKKENKYLENFGDKNKLSKYYAAFLESYDLVPSKGIVEMDNDDNEISLPYFNSDCYGIEITKKPFTSPNKRIIGIDGKIITNNKDIILKHGKFNTNINKINTYITKYTNNKELIDLLINLNLELKKNFYISMIGNINDENYKQKLRKLYELKKEIETYTGKNIDGQVCITNDYYLSAINPRYSLKLKKTNSK